MPLPFALVVILQIARQAALALLRRILLHVAGVITLAVLKYVMDRIRPWLEQYLPQIVLYYLKETTGLELEYPITSASLTAAVNQKIGENIFTDVTDRDAVELDLGEFARKRVEAAMPFGVTREDFKSNVSAKRRLARKMRVGLKRQIVMSWEQGESQLFSPPIVADMLHAARGDYSWRPHVNIDDVEHQVGREMAAWYRAHLTRTRV